jgi:hypothetical protein
MLWTSVILHVAALALNLTANITFFVNSTDATADLLWTWAVTSLIAHSLAVVGTVVITGFVKDVFTTPLINTLLMGLFLGGILATAKISYTHGLAQEATSTENVNTDAQPTIVSPFQICYRNLINRAFALIAAGHVQPVPRLPGVRVRFDYVERDCVRGVQGRHLDGHAFCGTQGARSGRLLQLPRLPRLPRAVFTAAILYMRENREGTGVWIGTAGTAPRTRDRERGARADGSYGARWVSRPKAWRMFLLFLSR